MDYALCLTVVGEWGLGYTLLRRMENLPDMVILATNFGEPLNVIYIFMARNLFLWQHARESVEKIRSMFGDN